MNDNDIRASQRSAIGYTAINGPVPPPSVFADVAQDTIHTAINGLYADIEGLAKGVAILQEKLGSVLREPQPVAVPINSDSAERDGRSEVERRISAAKNELRGLTNQIFDLAGRVAL